MTGLMTLSMISVSISSVGHGRIVLGRDHHGVNAKRACRRPYSTVHLALAHPAAARTVTGFSGLP
jgi:hypothetical protein